KRTIVFERQLFQEQFEGVTPSVNCARSSSSKSQILLESLLLPGKDPGHARRFEAGCAKRKFILLRRGKRHLHIIHRPARRHKEREQWRVRGFRAQKSVGKGSLVSVRKGEPAVLRQELVEERGAISIMTENEQRWLDGNSL